ncbi:dihydroorotate dehydrogenase-like protein [Nostocoides vanveenii]|uniref:Dihydroorotate dehydrogenase-like protein n=1 Tax=Nostocoides vanveenii TaxID=330835 RepID=A0ABN2KJW2_9MICO
MDLATTYLGLPLRNPLVASASPLSQTVAGVRALADAGVGAVVLYSLFEEQIRRQEIADFEIVAMHEDSFGEATSYFPDVDIAAGGATPYLRHLEKSVAAVDIPVIASLNGVNLEGWAQCARQLQDSGAAALEVNPYAVPGDTRVAGAVIEERHVEIVHTVKDAVSIPVAVKLSPFFSATGTMCRDLDAAGADGLVLFNRFLQPDIDIEALAVGPAVTLSSPVESGIARTWIAILRGRVAASLAATTGVESGADVVKYLLAGADVVMTASSLMRHGPAYAATLLTELTAWMERKGFASVADVRGLLALGDEVDAAAYERAGYVAALTHAKDMYGDFLVRN